MTKITGILSAIFLTEKSQSLKHEVSVLSNGSGMNSLNSTCNEELVSMLKDRKVFAHVLGCPEQYRGQHIRLKHLFRVETHKSVTFGLGSHTLDRNGWSRVEKH